MKMRFTGILLEISAFKKNKYTQREKNMKVLRALPPSWEIYAAMQPL